MYRVLIAWLYVVGLMAVVEALSTQGTVLGALFTLLLYGALPLSIVLYIMGTPARKRALRSREAAANAASGVEQGNGRGHAPGGAAGGTPVAAEREEP